MLESSYQQCRTLKISYVHYSDELEIYYHRYHDMSNNYKRMFTKTDKIVFINYIDKLFFASYNPNGIQIESKMIPTGGKHENRESICKP